VLEYDPQSIAVRQNLRSGIARQFDRRVNPCPPVLGRRKRLAVKSARFELLTAVVRLLLDEVHSLGAGHGKKRGSGVMFSGKQARNVDRNPAHHKPVPMKVHQEIDLEYRAEQCRHKQGGDEPTASFLKRLRIGVGETHTHPRFSGLSDFGGGSQIGAKQMSVRVFILKG